MSGQVPEHLPSRESIERDAAIAIREICRAVRRARAEHELLADAEGRGAGTAVRYAVAYRLRHIGRQLRRAQAVLVLPNDERYVASQLFLDELDRHADADAPWRDEAKAA